MRFIAFWTIPSLKGGMACQIWIKMKDQNVKLQNCDKAKLSQIVNQPRQSQICGQTSKNVAKKTKTTNKNYWTAAVTDEANEVSNYQSN